MQPQIPFPKPLKNIQHDNDAVLGGSMKIGELLVKASLINTGQLQVVLMEQDIYANYRLGEIIALHGWLAQETIDFFVEEWPQLLQTKEKHPLGFYLQRAALLTEAQIQQILKEQWQASYRFGALVVLNGWLKQETINFFLQHVNPNALKESTRIEKATLSDISRTTIPELARAKQTYTGEKQQIIDPEDLADIDLDDLKWLN